MDLNRRAAIAALASAAAAPAAAFAAESKRPKARAPAARPAAPSAWADADAAAHRIVEGRLSPGVALLVKKHGRVIHDGSTGLADLEAGTPMTARAVCRIGSITKQFTATAILLLAEDGKLSIDDALSVYLPDFPNAAKLPLRRILSHTAGLGNYTEEPFPQFLKDVRPDRSTSELVAWMAQGPNLQRSEPGTAWRYSNTGYVLLGAVVEKVAGQSYADFLSQRIFQPLGLVDTAYDRNADVVPHRAAGYTCAPRAASGFENAPFISMTAPGGAGALRSSVTDLCVWHEALLGGKVLKPQMLEQMLTPATLNDGKLPETTGPGGKTTTVRYGFGISVADPDGTKVISHNGGINGFASFLGTLPDAGVTYAMVLNSDGGPFAPKALASAPGDVIAAVRKAALAA